jgi:Iap family predicted aminopeptidase
MLEGEGPVWMERYAGAGLRDALAEWARRMEIPLERGFLARSSTDSVIPSRAGYPTATLVSITDWRMPANYHLPSDVPANLDYATVADATRLVRALAAGLEAGLEAARNGREATGVRS